MKASSAKSLGENLTQQNEAAEILAGLNKQPKTISAKYFYDERGSRLFDEICEQPEYYLTRTELGIMRAHLPEIARVIGPRVTLVEYGSGSSVKTKDLLDALDQPTAYIPVDISGEHLQLVAKRLAERYANIEVLPVCADFTQSIALPKPQGRTARRVVYFPGSTIGNFSRPQALKLLKKIRGEAGANGGLLIGVDLIKDDQDLEQAYNDAAGVTAKFNLNLLRHLNREFDCDFDLQAFEHEAIYDAVNQRIEMRLISQQDQAVEIQGEILNLKAGEYIVTEHSHKYSRAGFAAMAKESGFTVRGVWTDAEELFSVQFLETA